MPSSKSRDPLYGILGVYIPLSVLILWMTLAAATLRFFIRQDSAFYNLNGSLWCFAGFLSALVASWYAGAIKKSHFRHTAADIRGCILILAGTYILVSLFRSELVLTKRFIPCTDSVVSALAALYAWFFAISLKEIFNGIELFESFKARYRSEQLREAMREFSPEISQTDGKLKSLMRVYGIQFIFPCLITPGLLFRSAVSTRSSVFLTVLVFFIFVVGFLILGFLRLLRRELSFASEGISLTIRDRVMPIPVMIAGIGTATLLAAAASSETSLLPPQLLFGILQWLGKLLASLFRSKKELVDIPPPNIPQAPMHRSLADLFPDAEETGPWEGWKYVKYGFIAILIILFLLFMVYPILKRSGFTISLNRIYFAMLRWFRDLKQNLYAFFTALKDRGNSKMFNPDREKLRRIASELLSGNIKRKEVKRSVNLFARLILWGIETMDVQWKNTHAPGEYCSLLSRAVAQTNPLAPDSSAAENPDNTQEKKPDKTQICEDIIRSGELFEKALYSLLPLSAGEEKEFKMKVENITG